MKSETLNTTRIAQEALRRGIQIGEVYELFVGALTLCSLGIRPLDDFLHERCEMLAPDGESLCIRPDRAYIAILHETGAYLKEL